MTSACRELAKKVPAPPFEVGGTLVHVNKSSRNTGSLNPQIGSYFLITLPSISFQKLFFCPRLSLHHSLSFCKLD